ncbi:MAG: polysaccharide biosynthesis protein [Hyphomonadaceae bacterium]
MATQGKWLRTDLTLIGAAIVGAGQSPLPLVTRAPVWDLLEFSSAKAAAARILILADPPTDGATKRVLLERAADAGMKVFVLEGSALRELQLEDLIGRPMRAVDWVRIRELISGRRILITGGGGSIGGELARRVAGIAPGRLALLDSSEHNLYRIGLELRDAVPILADVRDPAAVRRWIGDERPDLVFHTAALKQVPVVEAFPCEGVLTNLLGLRNVVEASHEAGADVLFVSTDKAVDPSGVMGASKRLGELYCQALDRRGPHRVLPVRLGNVLGSAGSVAPLFQKQLSEGGPLTVTDPDVTRFFLSIPQAADSLLQAAAVGLGSQLRGSTFVIDMGEALPVVELAREVIRLSGKRPDADIAIVFTGLRPGEKLHESLVASEEWREPEPAPGVIAVSSDSRGLADICEIFDRLTMLARQGAESAVIKALFEAVGVAAAGQSKAALVG